MTLKLYPVEFPTHRFQARIARADEKVEQTKLPPGQMPIGAMAAAKA